MIKKAPCSMAIFAIFGLVILSVMIVTYWCIAVTFF
jgi:hypothetical protein